MVITIKYSTGQTFKIIVPKDTSENIITYALDDISTKVEERTAWTALWV